MGETCNHVTAAVFGVRPAVCTGLTNPSCISSTNEWLPSRKDIGPTKRYRTYKDLNFDRDEFAQRDKTKRPHP